MENIISNSNSNGVNSSKEEILNKIIVYTYVVASIVRV